MAQNKSLLIRVEKELSKLLPHVMEEYRRVVDRMAEALGEERFSQWAMEGVAMAQESVRAWEATTEYFRASPVAFGRVPYTSFTQWTQSGRELCKESPSLSASYFKASPSALMHVTASEIADWANLGRSLYKGTWKSSSLSTKFFEVSPILLEYLDFEDLKALVALLDGLAQKSYDLASEYLQSATLIFPKIGHERGSFIALNEYMLEHDWRDINGSLEAWSKTLLFLDETQRIRFVSLTQNLVKLGLANVTSFIQEATQAFADISPYLHSAVLSMAEGLSTVRALAVPLFLQSCPNLLKRLDLEELKEWFMEGVRLLQENPDAGFAYYRMESSRAEEMLEKLSSSLELEKIQDLLKLYCRALCGVNIDLVNQDELMKWGVGWVTPERGAKEEITEAAEEEEQGADGKEPKAKEEPKIKLFLPKTAGSYTTKEENFHWYKVISTHQTGHREFGSYDFSFLRRGNVFDTLRTRYGTLLGASEVELFFSLFPDRRLALDIFMVVEDSRIDFRVKRQYHGLRDSYVRVQKDSLKTRPAIQELPVREAMIEILVHLGIDGIREVPYPKYYASEARAVIDLAQQVLIPEATVEDVAEATIRIYNIICQLPNVKVPPDQWTEPGDEGLADESQVKEVMAQAGKGGHSSPVMPSLEDVEQQRYQPHKLVEYRGDYSPDLVQLLTRIKVTKVPKPEPQADETPTPQHMSLEDILKMMEENPEIEVELVEGEPGVDEAELENMMQQAGINPDALPENWKPAEVQEAEEEEEGEPLEEHPNTYIYDEWDFRAGDYRPRWCSVKELELELGEVNFYQDTLTTYAALAGQIRKQFELMVPELFSKIRRLQDGEEFDLDLVIESIIDKKTGTTPNDKVYWRRNKIERDVAVGILLDMSASTAEAIDETRRLTEQDMDAPDDPVQYLNWLRARRGQGFRRSYKRIIDLEKESIVLLIQALEAVGDSYGIYGFSGYGRENVEFYVVKDLEEALSEDVKKRIDKISPLHATRMGPAIRHTTTKLLEKDARTKILFMVSDGRPQDRGYSREGVEKEYAVHDTRMALREARNLDIIPFCLTVDKQGHDYLKEMCTDMLYEIVDDIRALPHRLPNFYRRVTAM